MDHLMAENIMKIIKTSKWGKSHQKVFLSCPEKTTVWSQISKLDVKSINKGFVATGCFKNELRIKLIIVITG